MARRPKDKQRSFEFVGWGGEREGAGRPRKEGAKLRHEARAPLASRFPALVTLRALRGVGSLRRAAAYEVVERAIRNVNEGDDGFRVVHHSAQTNHLHLIVEANGAEALARGMQGLAVSIARRVNRVAWRKGKVWADRYHARILRSPREVRFAICYVLQNTRRHETTEDEIVDPYWIDPCSSGPWFDGWRSLPDGFERPDETAPTAPPRTWLLAEGWRRYGLMRVDEVPRAAFG
jgi:hypothetical protein